MPEKVNKSDKEWRAELTDEEYKILREKETEPAFTGKYVDNKKRGTYVCAGCGEPLFKSDAKFDSGSGWPSFWKPVEDDKIDEDDDSSMGMKRTEILCKKCGGHLGHVFDDGPKPTGLRYCVNSASLKFEDEDD